MSETLNVAGIGSVELTFTERGSGQPLLLLHGGAGPISVGAWADLLARTRPARVITPTHPGFSGTPRPDALATVGGLARVYAAFLEELGLEDVSVIGNSIGGWIAAELALLAPKRIGSVVLVDAGGVDVPGHPIADVFSMPLAELSRLSYHDPARFQIDPSKLPPQAKAMMAGNRATLKLYGGNMVDPSLLARLSAVTSPTLVVWGESDASSIPIAAGPTPRRSRARSSSCSRARGTCRSWRPPSNWRRSCGPSSPSTLATAQTAR
jgi:pimeloyl-ACP methyl ester carboxylesterase